jgi:hypothetical protein
MPKWRVEQERARAEQDARWTEPKSNTEGDVLEIFEEQLSKPSSSKSVSPMNERARGVADEDEELLPVEALTAPAIEISPVTPEPKTLAPIELAVASAAALTPSSKSDAASASAITPQALPDEPSQAETSPAPTENTWTGEQVVLALEDPSSAPVASDLPPVATPAAEPMQESLFDFELTPDEPTKAANG